MDNKKESFLQELKGKNLKRCNIVFEMELEDWSVAEWSNAVCGEAGELANICKKIKRGDEEYNLEHLKTQQMLKEEIGDIAVYLDLLSQRCGLSLEECIKYSFNRVSTKKLSSIKL